MTSCWKKLLQNFFSSLLWFLRSMGSRIFSDFHWRSSHAKVPRTFFVIQSCFFNTSYVAGFPDIIVRATMLCDVTHQYLVICWTKDKFLLVLFFHVCYYCCCHIPVTVWTVVRLEGNFSDKSGSWITIRKYCFPRASYSINFCPHKSRVSE